jgi:hypothetical protein
MTIACPCCRASNETPTCRRCKADLTLLVAMETRRDYLIEEVRLALSRGGDALPMIVEAELLRSGSDTAQLRALSALLAGAYAEAIASRPAE